MRDFTKTAEPSGGSSTKTGNRFVIQKHAARRLHYDFRLELDGVLLSWAVPKGPSMKPGDRRLAVHVEDHPTDYADFEGIPQGEYGGGTVVVWDRGTWQPEGDAHDAMKQGKRTFTLAGDKLRGRFHLVRTAKSWLLFKGRDEDAIDTVPRVRARTRPSRRRSPGRSSPRASIRNASPRRRCHAGSRSSSAIRGRR